MARPRRDNLPKYLEFNLRTRSFYYKNPAMVRKANLGRKQDAAISLARTLNAQYRIEIEKQSRRLESAVDFGSPEFDIAFPKFIAKYVASYRLKPSTSTLIRQRQERLCRRLCGLQLATIDTQILREAIADCSQFEQSKMKTLLSRFFSYAKSNGTYPTCLQNPVDDLFVDPVPPKRRQRMTLHQFKTIYEFAPQWMQWLMTLAFHLALRRVDLVNLRFDDIVGERLVSPVRKSDSEARNMEATSVDFPIHPDVRQVIVESRKSSLKLGRCPFIVHRKPARVTRRAKEALENGVLEHPAQVLPDYATKSFKKARRIAKGQTNAFEGLSSRELPTLHEIRALSSHLYERAGFDIAAVQDLMAHTDPDMTRAYQKGHARKVLRVDMMLPYSLDD